MNWSLWGWFWRVCVIGAAATILVDFMADNWLVILGAGVVGGTVFALLGWLTLRPWGVR